MVFEPLVSSLLDESLLIVFTIYDVLLRCQAVSIDAPGSSISLDTFYRGRKMTASGAHQRIMPQEQSDYIFRRLT